MGWEGGQFFFKKIKFLFVWKNIFLKNNNIGVGWGVGVEVLTI